MNLHPEGIHTGHLRRPVNTLVAVFMHAGRGRKKKDTDITLYHHYRQKVMSILKQTANNRRQKYNNTRQPAHSEGEFQWSLYGFSSPPPSLTLLCAFAIRGKEKKCTLSCFYCSARTEGERGHLHTGTRTQSPPLFITFIQSTD